MCNVAHGTLVFKVGGMVFLLPHGSCILAPVDYYVWIAKVADCMHIKLKFSSQQCSHDQMSHSTTESTKSNVCPAKIRSAAAHSDQSSLYARRSSLFLATNTNCAAAHPDLSLCRKHMWFCRFCCALAQMIIWAASWQNQQNGMCAQRRLRSAWASGQSDQSLRCALSG